MRVTLFRPHRSATLAGGLVVGLSLALTGCVSGGDGAGPSASSPASASASHGFNDSDVTFARGAVSLQRQAAEMADLAPGRSRDPRILSLATRIKATQARWNETMKGCLSRWGSEMPTGMMGSTGGMMSGDTGMMSRRDLNGLARRSGPGFDHRFLALMRDHHRAVMDLAVAERERGMDPQAMMQARRMQHVQGRQLHDMTRLMRR